MTRDGALASHRLLAALALLFAYNAAAFTWFIAAGLPAHPGIFAAWFAGDVLVGLVALGLTERW